MESNLSFDNDVENEYKRLCSEAEYNELIYLISTGILPKEALDELLGSKRIDWFFF